MPSAAEKQVQSFEVYAREVIRPALLCERAPLRAEALQSRGPIAWSAAVGGRYRRVEPGWQWGPAWSTCWFRLSAMGRPPVSSGGRPLALRFSTDTEAQVWIKGVPLQGLDVNRDLAVLPAAVQRGKSHKIVLHVEAACNHPFGAAGLQWDTPEVHRRWQGPTPGRFLFAELVTLEPEVQRLLDAWNLAVELARELLPPPPPNTTHSQKYPENLAWQESRCEELLGALRGAAREIDPHDVASSAPRAARILGACLSRAPAASTTLCHAVGHAHIDTAWLWPLRETRRKCIRSFSNVLRLMDSHPRFHFVCSQAQQYQWVEQDSPRLFEQIRRRVREGRWEPGGGMWVEPDCSVPTAESLIRQVLHGTRFWADRFGAAAHQSFLYLPDTFGFPAHLPQVMRHTGLSTFITNKMSWNDTNPFPHTTFAWRGSDGSSVLAHFTPGNDYNATNSPRELRRGQTNHRTKQLPAMPARDGVSSVAGARWLQPFGFGDGGGGPTAEMIRRAEFAGSCDGLPRVTQSRVDRFCELLRADVAAAAKRGEELPAWTGELYLELHRGTTTTQAWLKRAMRESEDALRLAEILHAMRLGADPRTRDAEFRSELNNAWKTLLLNQFHDILPGSSITAVYDDARRDMAEVELVAARHAQTHTRELPAVLASALEGLKPWKAPASSRSAQSAAGTVINPASVAVRQVSRVGRRLALLAAPALSIGPAIVARPEDTERCILTTDERRRVAKLSNGLASFQVDSIGRVTMAAAAGGQSVVAPGSPLNALVMHEDHPRMWDAWDVDESIHLKARPQVKPATDWRIVERGELCCALRIARPIGAASRVTQTFTLHAASPRLDIVTEIEWHEEHRMLRALFPTCIRAGHATFDIGGGSITRPTARNTSWDDAAFEVPGHRWSDLSEPGAARGLAVLNDSKYGHSCRGGTLGLTLLRSPRYPDPTADIGVHRFTYSLLPHRGDWRAASVPHWAEQLTRPLVVGGSGEAPAKAYSPVELSTLHGRAAFTVSALKPAEDPGRIVLRLQEVHGGDDRLRVRWNFPVAGVEPVNGLESPERLPGFGWNSRTQTCTLAVRPFQIISLAATLPRTRQAGKRASR